MSDGEILLRSSHMLDEEAVRHAVFTSVSRQDGVRRTGVDIDTADTPQNQTALAEPCCVLPLELLRSRRARERRY